MNTIDVLIVASGSHQELADDHFRSSLPVESGGNVLQKKLDLAGSGEYLSETWQTGVTAKLRWALEYIDSHPTETTFILSDVDIQFFPNFSFVALRELLDQSGVDVLFQKESRSPDSFEVNTGFYVARSTAWVRDLLVRAIELCDRSEVKNDQTALNELLANESLGVKWGFLPFDYYARSQGFPPSRTILLHHANFSGSIPEKIAALRRVRRYVTGGTADRVIARSQELIDEARSGKLRMRLRNVIRS